jgi:hypothetical protein
MKVVFKKQLTTKKNLPMRKMREEGAGGGLGAPCVFVVHPVVPLSPSLVAIFVLHVSIPLFPALQCPFPPHEQWLMAVVGWCCWHWSSSSSSCWSLSSRRYGRRGPVTILVAPRFHPREQLLVAAVGVLSWWWSLSYQQCCYGGGV